MIQDESNFIGIWRAYQRITGSQAILRATKLTATTHDSHSPLTDIYNYHVGDACVMS